MITRISAQNNTNFKGAVKIEASHSNAKKFDTAIRTFVREESTSGMHSICGANIATYSFKELGDRPAEPEALRLLKELKIPFLYNKKPDLSSREVQDFHDYVEIGKAK